MPFRSTFGRSRARVFTAVGIVIFGTASSGFAGCVTSLNVGVARLAGSVSNLWTGPGSDVRFVPAANTVTET